MDNMIGIQKLGEYDAACRQLQHLREEFEEAVNEWYPPLGHQLISPLDGPWSNTQWSEFTRANTHADGEWQKFEVFPGGDSCGRFFGTDTSLASFMRMAEIGMRTLQTLSTLKLEGNAAVPDGLIIRLPAAAGYQGWLQLLYETGRCYPTAFLHAEPGHWGCTGQFDWNEHAHPFYEQLGYDVFRSSAVAISLFFEPASEAEITSDRTADEPPVYLPPEPEGNGPYPPDQFWLWGKSYRFAPKPWQLLEFLWGKGPVKKIEAMRHVYGGADDAEEKITNLAKRLRAELASQDCPMEAHTGGAYIYLEYFKPHPATQPLADHHGETAPN
jgi:hypothetical protein